MQRAYDVLLRLLPPDFRTAFSGVMRNDFAQRLRAARVQGVWTAAGLALRELLSLVPCAASEWVDKVTAPPFQRDMIFRDRSRMRPPEASKAFWYDL